MVSLSLCVFFSRAFVCPSLQIFKQNVLDEQQQKERKKNPLATLEQMLHIFNFSSFSIHRCRWLHTHTHRKETEICVPNIYLIKCCLFIRHRSRAPSRDTPSKPFAVEEEEKNTETYMNKQEYLVKKKKECSG